MTMVVEHRDFKSYGEFTNYCVIHRIILTRAQRRAAIRYFWQDEARSRL